MTLDKILAPKSSKVFNSLIIISFYVTSIVRKSYFISNSLSGITVSLLAIELIQTVPIVGTTCNYQNTVS